MNGVVEVVHAEQGEGHFFIVFNILLSQKVLVLQEFFFVLVVSMVLFVVKAMRENYVKGAVVLIVLNQLVTIHNLF